MKKAKVLTDKQISNLLTLTRAGNKGERNSAIITLSFYLGLRAKELASLKIGDMLNSDYKLKDTVELNKSYTKGQKHRTIYLANPKVKNELVKYLNFLRTDKKTGELLSGDKLNLKDPLFKSQKGYHMTANTMVHLIKTLFERAGGDFDGCSSHSGRRTVITKLVNSGISLNKVKEIAGHSSINTTLEYVDTDPVDLANVMKSL